MSNVMNIGQRFETWVSEPNQKEKFQFVDDNFASLSADKKPAAYKAALTKFSESRIANNDTNKNGKMELDEYIGEQKRLYTEIYGEAIDMNIKGMKQTITDSFNAGDIDKDGSIDKNEMKAVISYMDLNDDKEKLDGKITYESAMDTNWKQTDLPLVLAKLETKFAEKSEMMANKIIKTAVISSIVGGLATLAYSIPKKLGIIKGGVLATGAAIVTGIVATVIKSATEATKFVDENLNK